ncbi:MAG: lactoylglutathione lyase [Gammaproteobacteria bacterium]|nr:MAG: lactoylglutathione lyase [Gammaproteobacteria bacterium]
MKFTGEQYAGVVEPPKATEGFVFNHTMLRIKDPEVSLNFYSRVLGMTVLRKLDFPEMQFSLYFLARLRADEVIATDRDQRTEQTFSRESVLELTHNWGSENDDDCHYHNGNDQPQGFGHICFSVPDLAQAIAWFDSNEVNYIKRPEDGKLKDVAFIQDPDGYWIEIVEAAKMRAFNTP